MELIRNFSITRYQQGRLHEVDDVVITEFPLTLWVNGHKFITLLCSPLALDYLAVGFLIAEGIITNKEDIISLDDNADRGVVEIELRQDVLVDSHFRNRAMTTGCGKGSMLYDVVEAFQDRCVQSNMHISASRLLELMNSFNQSSALFLKTGGVHSACLSTPFDMVLFHEDVGRHNAMDKIIGEAVMRDIELTDKILLTSGRISSEMLLKAAKKEIPIIVSRSGPTDMALDLAQRLGITVVGFARGNRMNIYSGKGRIVE